MGELLLGKPLMNGKNEMDQVQKMVRHQTSFVSAIELSYSKKC
jgi:hypothetical protein